MIEAGKIVSSRIEELLSNPFGLLRCKSGCPGSPTTNDDRCDVGAGAFLFFLLLLLLLQVL